MPISKPDPIPCEDFDHFGLSRPLLLVDNGTERCDRENTCTGAGLRFRVSHDSGLRNHISQRDPESQRSDHMGRGGRLALSGNISAKLPPSTNGQMYLLRKDNTTFSAVLFQGALHHSQFNRIDIY